jgi:hypothetical protein
MAGVTDGGVQTFAIAGGSEHEQFGVSRRLEIDRCGRPERSQTSAETCASMTKEQSAGLSAGRPKLSR